MRSSFIPLLCLLSLLGCSSQSGVVTTSGASEAARLHKPFLGRWTGALEYRDYQSDGRVRLPTELEVTPQGEGTALRFSYLYDDGPTKKVREASTVVIDSVARTMTVASEGGGEASVYRFADEADLTGLRDRGEGVFTLSGTGVENDRPVRVRLTLRLQGGRYQLLRETQAPGEDFRFRHEYTFTRAG